MAYIYDLIDTWNNAGTTFTAIKMNVTDTASNAASLLMDLQVGGSSRFRVSKAGAVTFDNAVFSTPNNGYLYADRFYLRNAASTINFLTTYNQGITIPSGNFFGFSSGIDNNVATGDLFLTRRAAANLRFGAADVGATTSTVTITIATPGVVTWTGHTLSTGTPVVFTTTGALPTGITAGTTYYAVVVDANTFQIASSVANAIAATPTVITTSGTQSGTHTGTRYNITQRLGMQSVTGVTDRLGADLIIQGSQGTGTGAGGSIIFQVAPAGTTGTSQNALATALTIASDQNATFVGNVTCLRIVAPTAGSILSSTTVGSRISLQGIINGISVGSDCFYAFHNAASGSGTVDLILARDTSNILAQRNGANAQESRVYGTFTDASNYRRVSFGMSTAGVGFIRPEGAGTGATGNVIHISGLPTANPGAGILWNDAGTVKVGT